MKVVGFGHRSRHGKDTAGKFLDTHLRVKCPKLRVKRINFADKLKAICFDLYNWAGVKRGVHYDNYPLDRNIIIPALGMTVVDLWVSVGEKMREVFPTTWLDFVTKADHQADVVIICDVRHPNEANTIVEHPNDWCLYKVLNPRIPNREDTPGAKSIDAMLKDYDRWHDTILNDGELADLNQKMDILSDQLIVGWKLRG